MRGRDGHADERSSADCESGGGFGGEAVYGLQLHHLMSERTDDAPATRRGPCGHGGRAKRDDPKRNVGILVRLHES